MQTVIWRGAEARFEIQPERGRRPGEVEPGAENMDGPDQDGSGAARLSALAAFVVLVATLGASSLDPARAAAPTPRLSRLDPPGEEVGWVGQPTILMFWRADCAPCLVELGHLRPLEAASGRVRLVLVSLDDAPTARAKLKAMGLTPRHAWRLRDDPATTLSALGRGAPRLPLSAAYDSAGRPCGLRIGLLGVDQVRNWARACS